MPNKYQCSDGTYVTDSVIRFRYLSSKKEKHAGTMCIPMCEGCESERGNDNDHTIAQARCKVLGKTELIWNQMCYVWSCRKCHHQWENFKSGEWVHHKNVEQRMAFLKEHDPEGYTKRIEFTKAALENTAK